MASADSPRLLDLSISTLHQFYHHMAFDELTTLFNSELDKLIEEWELLIDITNEHVRLYNRKTTQMLQILFYRARHRDIITDFKNLPYQLLLKHIYDFQHLMELQTCHLRNQRPPSSSSSSSNDDTSPATTTTTVSTSTPSSPSHAT